MIRRFMDMLASWRQRRRQARELRPEHFREMVDDLNNLTVMAARVRQESEKNAACMDSVRRELEQLAKRLDDPGFHRLPVERRREIKDGLDRSREAVLDVLQSSCPPTAYLQ